MLNKLRKRLKSKMKDEKGESNTIEMLFIVLIVTYLTITAIDCASYFNNRTMITNAAQNGARLTAVYGGSGNTQIAKTYGTTDRPQVCQQVNANGPAACQVAQELQTEKGDGINLDIKNVNCYVNSSGQDDHKSTVENLQDRPTCSITFEYYGFPGSLMSFRDQLHPDITITETSNAEVIQNKD